MIAHHEVLMVLQGGAGVGLAGWAAAIGAKWYSLTRRRPVSASPSESAATERDPSR